MALSSLLGSFRFSFMPRPLTPRPWLVAHWAFRAARNLPVHFVQRARNVVGDVRDLDVAEYVFELCGDAVAAGNRFTERNGFPNNLEISATGSAKLQVRS